MALTVQPLLFHTSPPVRDVCDKGAGTFADNLRLPVHRWVRFSAGFSAVWAQSVIVEAAARQAVCVLDPFVGSGTTLLAAEDAGVESWGLDAHPFLHRLARAKLSRRSDPAAYLAHVRSVRAEARRRTPDVAHYPTLIRRCYGDDVLARLDVLRQAIDALNDGTPAAELGWLTLVGILRKASQVGTAQWQYVLPRKRKKSPQEPFQAFDELARMVYEDMSCYAPHRGPAAKLLLSDARTCAGVPDQTVDLVLTSPPYPNNYDYADATRLEMCFLGEIRGWAELHAAVRARLVRSCTQHVPERSVDLAAVLADPLLAPVRTEITAVCEELASVRLSHGGKKTYHLMVACYFLDLAGVWTALRRVCRSPSQLCFVVGDSAPYGVYVPVMEWLGRLAISAGFRSSHFERMRDRNVKWKNRKHRVPLCEGRLWVAG
jgi:hypothetical protein